MMVALAAMQGLFLNQDLDGNRFGHTADGRPGWKDGADTVHPFSTPAIISMIQLLPGLNNYAGNVITLDVTEKINYTLIQCSPGTMMPTSALMLMEQRYFPKSIKLAAVIGWILPR